MKWIWHKLIPIKISLYMWKATLRFLLVDDKIREIDISLASTCNCCDNKLEETLDHILRIGKVVRKAWSKAASYHILLNNR